MHIPQALSLDQENVTLLNSNDCNFFAFLFFFELIRPAMEKNPLRCNLCTILQV